MNFFRNVTLRNFVFTGLLAGLYFIGPHKLASKGVEPPAIAQRTLAKALRIVTTMPA